MAHLERKYLRKVQGHFNNWMDIKSFPEDIHNRLDFDIFYETEVINDSGVPKDFYSNPFWEDCLTRLQSQLETFRIRQKEYLEELPLLIDEVDNNGCNLLHESSKAPGYVKDLYSQYTLMIQQIDGIDKRWEDDQSKYSRSHFEELMKAIPLSDFWERIFFILQELCWHINGAIDIFKEQLAKLNEVITQYFGEEISSHSAVVNSSKEGLSLVHAEICLIRIYNQKPITEINKDIIALEYGLTAKGAGKVLLKKFNELDSSDDHRLSRPKLAKYIATIKDKLTSDGLKRAEKDLKTVRDKRR